KGVGVIRNADYPSVVKVIAPGGRGLCSGTFISPRAVLTAAHCTRPFPTGTFTVSTSFGVFSTSKVEELGSGSVDDPRDIAVLIFDQNVADPSKGQVSQISQEIQSGES